LIKSFKRTATKKEYQQLIISFEIDHLPVIYA